MYMLVCLRVCIVFIYACACIIVFTHDALCCMMMIVIVIHHHASSIVHHRASSIVHQHHSNQHHHHRHRNCHRYGHCLACICGYVYDFIIMPSRMPRFMHYRTFLLFCIFLVCAGILVGVIIGIRIAIIIFILL